ncbi:hypothetical protein KSS87_022514 [Heliosperma pusillum]|nr:hypothetical protein KSS87_022514 [Heliosperma pusillum]
MDEHQQHQHRRIFRPSTSGTNGDTNSIYIDMNIVVPDTPDRVCNVQKNARQGISTSPHYNSRASGQANRAIFDRRALRFGDNTKTSEIDYNARGDIVNIDRNRRTGDAAVAPTFRNASTSNSVADPNLKLKGHYSNHTKTSGIDYNGRGDFVSIDRIRRTGDPAAAPTFRNAYTSNSVADRNLKLKGHYSNHPDVENGSFSHSRSLKLSDHHHNRRVDIANAPKDLVSLHSPGLSIKPTRNDDKGKVKIGNSNHVPSVGKPVERNDEIFHVSSEHYTGDRLTVPLQSVRGRTTKRLVRNGCISPHNIAKANVSAESSSVRSENAVCNAVSAGSRNVIDIDKVIAEENTAKQSKGKGVLIHPSSSKGPEDRCDIGNARLNGSSTIILDKCSSSFGPSSLEVMPVLNGGEVYAPSSSKKQKTLGGCSNTPGEKGEIICLSSGGESLAAKSARHKHVRPPRAMGSPIVVGNFSPEARECESQSADNDNQTRAIQLEVDEMMARALQEQLYSEMPEATSGEAFFGSAGEASINPAPVRRRQRAHANIDIRRSNTGRGSQIPSLRSRLRQAHQARIPSSGVASLRARINRHPSMAASRGRRRLFPSHMDVDMRIELLEALEAVADEDIRMVNQLLHSDREFGEDDYEMLLALDENNHEHLGASVAHIANLPESQVRSESTELCSICIETPAIGDTMRHLPCLHKFHKDCIDPWLRRKRSCPIWIHCQIQPLEVSMLHLDKRLENTMIQDGQELATAAARRASGPSKPVFQPDNLQFHSFGTCKRVLEAMKSKQQEGVNGQQQKQMMMQIHCNKSNVKKFKRSSSTLEDDGASSAIFFLAFIALVPSF